jgi:hypothetical protein
MTENQPMVTSGTANDDIDALADVTTTPRPRTKAEE